MEIRYRSLQPSEREKYRAIRLECLKNFPDNFGTTWEEESKAASLKLDKALTANNTHDFIYGAFHNETLIGICGFLQQERLKTKHRGEIIQMYVIPSFSGQGIGTDLLKHSIEKAFENEIIEQILLGVVYTNERAVATYKKLGFVQYGMLEHYFKMDGQSWPQLFMVLERKNYSPL